MNEDHLCRVLAAQAQKNCTQEPELLWASWEHKGPAYALPMAVLLDHAHKQVVISVRGTADVTDMINDIGVMPTFFDPLDMATGVEAMQPPFDTERDLFVPSVWLSAATDSRRLLQEKGMWDLVVSESKARAYRIVVTGHSLGAGVACLLAFFLRAENPTEQEVTYVGFEPPGCVLSRRLARKTQELGWIGVVCAHDWVPRLSVRNIQRLQEQAYDELEVCDRSKWQLTCLSMAGFIDQLRCLGCFRSILSKPFAVLGGGSLFQPRSAYQPLDRISLPRSAPEFPDMCPPGDVLYLRPVANEWLCCGWVERDTDWSAEWLDPEDVQQEFVLSTRAFSLHTPWIYEHAIGCVADAYRDLPCGAWRLTRGGGRRPR